MPVNEERLLKLIQQQTRNACLLFEMVKDINATVKELQADRVEDLTEEFENLSEELTNLKERYNK